LISNDFYQGQQLGLLDEETLYRINAFDWETEFAPILKAGGFDAVIGNPPYVRQELLSDWKSYFQQHYHTYHGASHYYVIMDDLASSSPTNGCEPIMANPYVNT